MRKATQKRGSSQKKLLVTLGIVVVLGLGAFGAKHIYDNRHPAPHVTASQNTKGEVSAPAPSTDESSAPGSTTSTSNTSSNTTSNTQPGDNKNNPGTTTTAVLVDPSGDFVSAHRVTLGSSLTSVCTTTSGATCSISFQGPGGTKTLSSQTTDRGGAAYWNNWTPKSLGLTTGSWQIIATARLNGQTKTATDAMNLEISS